MEKRLSQQPVGSRIRISGHGNDRLLTRRLIGMGLRAGAAIMVLLHRPQGTVVMTSGARVALSNDIASQLQVEMAPAGEEE